MSATRCSSERRLAAPLLALCLLGMLLAPLLAPAPLLAQTSAPAPAARAPRGGRRGQPPHARRGRDPAHGRERTDPPPRGARRLRAGPRLRARHLQAHRGPARPLVDAGDLGADLRDLQDVSRHAGQVPPHPRDLHRVHHRPLLRGPLAAGADARPDHPAVQPHRHRRELRGRLVRHADQHLRELADGLREPRGPAATRLLHPARVGHEHRDAAHQRGALPDAVHPALRPGGVRGALLHRLRDRGVPRRGGPPDRGRDLHEDRGHRLGPDEDRLQHQGGRRPEPGRHRRLHGRQRRGLRRPHRRRLRDLRRHGRRADLLHPPRGEGSDGPGAAAGLDLRHARPDDRGQRRVLPDQRDDHPQPIHRRPGDELREAAHVSRLADVGRVRGHHVRGLLPSDPGARRRDPVVEALHRHHLRDPGRRDHPGIRQDLHVDRVERTSARSSRRRARAAPH